MTSKSHIRTSAVLVCSTDRDMRLLGYSFYAAWPKLFLIGLVAVTPPLVYGSFRVLSYETVGGAAPPIAVFLLLALAVGAALLVVAWLMVVALTRAPKKVGARWEAIGSRWARDRSKIQTLFGTGLTLVMPSLHPLVICSCRCSRRSQIRSGRRAHRARVAPPRPHHARHGTRWPRRPCRRRRHKTARRTS